MIALVSYGKWAAGGRRRGARSPRQRAERRHTDADGSGWYLRGACARDVGAWARPSRAAYPYARRCFVAARVGPGARRRCGRTAAVARTRTVCTDVTDDVADAVGSRGCGVRNITWKNTPERVCECATAHAGPRTDNKDDTRQDRSLSLRHWSHPHHRDRAPRRTALWSNTSAAATPAGLDRTRVDSTLRAVIRVGCHTRRTIDAQDLV